MSWHLTARAARRYRKRLAALQSDLARLERFAEASRRANATRAGGWGALLGRTWAAASAAYDRLERLAGANANLALDRPRARPSVGPDRWLDDPRPHCPVCGQVSSTVLQRPNPFHVEGIEICPEHMESCLSCWQEKRDSI